MAPKANPNPGTGNAGLLDLCNWLHGSGGLGGGISVTETEASSPDLFYRREYDGQLRRAYLFLGDLAQAQDAVHDAFVAILGRWESIKDPGPYLNRCVLNACRDKAGGRARSRDAQAPDAADRLAALPGPGDSRMAELWDVLNELSFNQRSALVLRYFEGCTENEIAHHLDVRPGTVGPLITRALRALNQKVAS